MNKRGEVVSVDFNGSYDCFKRLGFRVLFTRKRMEFGIRQNKINVREATKVTVNHGRTNGTREQRDSIFLCFKRINIFLYFKII